MGKQIDLTTGPITGKLIKLAMPIMGVSFVQTAYSLIDMIWIGKAGSAALAAVGTAGFFTWLAEAFYMLPRLGASIRVAQSVGQKDYKTVLQEKLQVKGNVKIEYILLDSKGPDHDKIFVVEVKCDGKSLACGEGRTKKGAEMEAARQALQNN